MAEEDKDPKATTSPPSLTASAEKTKETAKWLVVTFGALGAALIGSASLADLSKLSADGEEQAFYGLFLGLIGIIAVIIPAAHVMASQITSLTEVATSWRPSARFRRSRINKHHPFLAGSGRTVEQLADEKSLYQYQKIRAQREARGLPGPTKPSGIEDDIKRFEAGLDEKRTPDERLERAQAGLDSTDPYVRNVADYIAASSLNARFTFAVLMLIVGSFIAAYGAVMFTTAETKEEAKQRDEAASPVVDLAAQPVSASVAFEDEAVDRYQPLLGQTCDLDSVDVIALDSTDDSVEVVTTGQGGCQLRHLEIETSEAEVFTNEAACERTVQTNKAARRGGDTGTRCT